MDYEPKIIPEGINTSKEHPLREFATLVFGLAAVIILVTTLLALSTDYLIQYIPVEKENQWFSNQALADSSGDDSEKVNPLESEVETWLLQMVEQLRPEDKPGYRFTVNLIQSDVPNAFIIPGGHIFVTSELLKHVQSENGLTMVLAHEMSHHFHRHPLRGLGRVIVISLALMVISGAESDTLVQNFVGNAVVLTSLNFNRDQERDADRLAVELMEKYYDHASGAAEFFESMKQQSQTGIEIPEFLQTHPGVDERIDMLNAASRRNSGDKTSLPVEIVQYLKYLRNNR